ncbi:MAG: winged helix-turn-helix domain-containing protein, partial [Rhodospirillaceae bacterium]|nr:winged helix-turn-helix domain-containing protein [Rhodospirillaceae bacterium]
TKYADQSGPSDKLGVLKISQSELGQMMGVSRESINKCLRAWSNDGWINLSRGKISILETGALEQMIKDEESGLK